MSVTTENTEENKVKTLEECCRAWRAGCREFDYFSGLGWRDAGRTNPADFVAGWIHRPRPGWDARPEMIDLTRKDVLRAKRVFRWKGNENSWFRADGANQNGAWLRMDYNQELKFLTFSQMRDFLEYSDNATTNDTPTWCKCEKEKK